MKYFYYFQINTLISYKYESNFFDSILREIKTFFSRSIKTQRRQFKNIDQEIRIILRSTEVQEQG
jgi:hypothetical protein